MRIRTIKPDFYKNEVLAEKCEPLARILFTGLWGLADVAGRLEDRPKRIKIDVLPYDACDVDSLLESLAQAGFIVRYAVAGLRLIHIPGFRKHQRLTGKEAEGESDLPPPPQSGSNEEAAGNQSGNNGEAPGCFTDAQEGKGREGNEEGKPKPREKTPRADAKAAESTNRPASVEEVIAHGKMPTCPMSEEECRLFFDTFEGKKDERTGDWVDSLGNRIGDWRARQRRWGVENRGKEVARPAAPKAAQADPFPPGNWRDLADKIIEMAKRGAPKDQIFKDRVDEMERCAPVDPWAYIEKALGKDATFQLRRIEP